jgi:quinol monooxygenase YgiN
MDRRTFLSDGLATAAGVAVIADALPAPGLPPPACHRRQIAIIAELKFATGTGAAAAEALTTLALATLAEPGCRRYIVSRDLGDPDRFHLSELWDDLNALADHFATPHMAAFSARARRLGYAAPFLKLIRIAESSDLRPADLESLRGTHSSSTGTEPC